MPFRSCTCFPLGLFPAKLSIAIRYIGTQRALIGGSTSLALFLQLFHLQELFYLALPSYSPVSVLFLVYNVRNPETFKHVEVTRIFLECGVGVIVSCVGTGACRSYKPVQVGPIAFYHVNDPRIFLRTVWKRQPKTRTSPGVIGRRSRGIRDSAPAVWHRSGSDPISNQLVDIISIIYRRCHLTNTRRWVMSS